MNDDWSIFKGFKIDEDTYSSYFWPVTFANAWPSRANPMLLYDGSVRGGKTVGDLARNPKSSWNG